MTANLDSTDNEPVVITPQIAAEFWNVATRPVEQNGLGWSHQQALDAIVRIEGFFSVLIESADLYAEWKRVVVAHGVTGVQAHDARLVAAIQGRRPRTSHQPGQCYEHRQPR
jgi:hypothetical protein